MKLTEIKGIGPKTETLLQKLGLYTAEDLVQYYPVTYDTYAAPLPVSMLRDGEKSSVLGRVRKAPVLRRFQKISVLSADVEAEGGALRVTWFNAPFMAHAVKAGLSYVFRGVVREKKGSFVMEHPEVIAPEKYPLLQKTLVPVYGLTKGLSGKTLQKAVREALSMQLPLLHDPLPEDMRQELTLMGREEALTKIHFPEDADECAAARERLVFDEFFFFVLGIRTLKSAKEGSEQAVPLKSSWVTEDVLDALPFALTGAQLRTWREIERDLTKSRPMARLVQGDVGSGKTVIAFLALLHAAANRCQGALMAPTEVLASQHYEKLLKLMKDAGISDIKAVLLTGSTKAAERRKILKEIREGEALLIIGTHAIFQEGVEYASLALVITDEQHRFGVRQRQTLADKGGDGRTPHTLVMSATPIPRTLGVIYYGDLDLSVIDELPKRRLPIKTAVVDLSYREKALRFILREMESGRQVYVICPMISPSEELEVANVEEEYLALKKAFPEQKTAKLHGAMSAKEKTEVMEAFAKGETDLLVSTTVIEVGVDVPNATVMWVEHAERFGLAQLHQLRGRVGRGEHQSYCVFMAGQGNEETAKRLGILKESNDGFVIAQKDFALRGPGDLLGIRQSGDASFRIADVTRDGLLLQAAGEAAARLLSEDPGLKSPEHASIRRILQEYLDVQGCGITL